MEKDKEEKEIHDEDIDEKRKRVAKDLKDYDRFFDRLSTLSYQLIHLTYCLRRNKEEDTLVIVKSGKRSHELLLPKSHLIPLLVQEVSLIQNILEEY